MTMIIISSVMCDKMDYMNFDSTMALCITIVMHKFPYCSTHGLLQCTFTYKRSYDYYSSEDKHACMEI